MKILIGEGYIIVSGGTDSEFDRAYGKLIEAGVCEIEAYCGKRGPQHLEDGTTYRHGALTGLSI